MAKHHAALRRRGKATRSSSTSDTREVLETGEFHFSVEARLLRELGERLVKQPEVAFVELIKNAFDADAETCTLTVGLETVEIADTGHGMTLEEFQSGWMRIGTASKSASSESRRYVRPVTGEKGIGRFAVRYLGRSLTLRTVAYDAKRKQRTILEATFDWSDVDQYADLGRVAVPYTLRAAAADEALGTTLVIGALRVQLHDVKWDEIRTASIGLLSPTRSFLKEVLGETKTARHSNQQDPGFSLFIRGVGETADELRDVAAEILASYVLRAVLKIDGQRLSLDVYRRPAQDDESRKPELTIREAFKNEIGPVTAEIRFYPRRKGSFSGLPVDGRRALSWVSRNSGVAVYDRAFRVLPYGVRGDDWLRTAADTARRHRVPRSGLAEKHFPMSQAEQASTELNYMLRLPHPQQLIGAVFVEGARGRTGHATRGLIAAADREGFLDNEAYQQLWDVVRGAVEAIAYVDRRLQKQQEDADRRAAIRRLRAETQQAIKEIQANPRLKPQDRQRLIDRFTRTQADAEAHEAAARRRELQLETLSLLGVVAGFMTHEFGVALDALLKSQKRVAALAPRIPELEQEADALARHIATLNEFASYSRAYIGASADAPAARYSARPRLQQVARVFGAYAVERGITVDIEVSKDVLAPPVPVALYNGVALNLYTNALKAVSALAGDGDRRITFRAWNEGTTHILLVLDTGVGIPTTMRERIFDPLISTTMQNSDPLGSGLGLGLTLVRRAVESFRGRATVVDPPPGFTTAVEVRLPLPRED